MLWQPMSDVTVKLGADVSDTDSNGAGTSVNPNPTGEMLDSPINEAAKKGAVTWKVGAEMDLSPSSLMFGEHLLPPGAPATENLRCQRPQIILI